MITTSRCKLNTLEAEAKIGGAGCKYGATGTYGASTVQECYQWGGRGFIEPLGVYGSSRLPLTNENVSGMDRWGHKTASASKAAPLDPSTFNATYLSGDLKYDFHEPAPKKGSREESIRVLREHFGDKRFTDVATLIKNLPIAQAQHLRDAS